MKTKHLFLAFFFLTFTFIANAQQVIYNETYSSTNGWPEGNNTTRELIVKNGKYYFEHKRKDKNWNVRTPELEIDLNGDFELETSIERISFDNANHAFGFMFGNKDDKNTFHFYLSNNQYRVSDKRNDEYVNYKGWKTSSAINTGTNATNRFKVKKVGNVMSFYINDSFLESKNYNAFTGKRLGIYIFDKQKIAIDYIKATQISTNPIVNTTTTNGNIILEDDFTSNKGNWAESSTSDAVLEVKNNRYYFEHKRTSGGWSSTKVVDIDDNKDFEIESRFLKIGGINNNGYGFVFGRKDGNNQFVFTITGDGSYSIDQYVDGKYTALKEWTKSEHIKTGDYAYNTLKIKKERGFIKFYVNDRYLTLYTHKPFLGNRFGFIVYNDQKIAINDLKIKYINQSNVTVNNNVTTTTTTGSVIMEDDFSSDKNGWAESSTESAEIELRNGKYYFSHKRDSGGWTSTQVVDIDTNKDFEIESKFTKISGINNNGFGFVFGRKDGDNQFVFTITSNGSYSIDQYIDGKYTALKDWTKSSYINTGDNAVNTLKIKKERGFIKFYVNDRYLTLYTHKPFMGNRFGYVVYHKQKVAIDDLNIKYINQNDNNDNVVVANGENVLSDYFTNNNNNWPTTNSSGNTIMSVANNYYNFEHLNESSGWAVNIPKTIDTSRDFEIITRIKKASGVNNISYGLQWGKEGKSSFRFYITGNGYYKIARVVDDKEELIKKFTLSSAIKKGNGEFNTLKIRKESGQYKFYINNTFITQTDFEAFFGHRLGYVVFNKQKISVDYITIKYLKKSKNTIVTSNTLTVPLNESFANNTNGWNLSDDTNAKTRISNGKLYVKSNNEKGGAFISKKVGIDTSRDFIIETSLTRLTSSSNGSIAFVFGRQNNTNEFDLFLSKDGSYLFRKLENDVSNKLIPWTETTTLNTQTYQPNKIKIVKTNNLLRIYINDQYVNEAPYSKFFGDYIGFSVYNQQEISVDYLNVTYPSSSFNTPPEVVIIEPVVQRGFKIVKTKTILVRGKATDKDGIFEITVNGVEASVSENGTFTANVPLKYGENDLIVKATDMKKASSTKTFTIKRKSPDVVDVKDDDVIVVNNDNKGFGEYYALLIGVSDYGDGAITDLGGLPTKDAQDLGNVLINKYSFKKQNVVILNNSPTENDIIKEFSKLKKKVTDKDNLLVFYAGHGVYDEVSQVGHWLPSDADMEYELNLISNSQVVDFLKSIRSKHTLLISDACFSGSIFKTRSFDKSPKSIQKKFELTSRKAITSGTLKTVPNKSMFLKYLLDRLQNNPNNYLSARQLFDKIEEPVMNNSPNTPQYGTIYGIGDEGGDFIFVKKE
ncbi:caspase family protein [Polaribacter uvawellassae]|uniref:caspase family protein n=1 Tax=Polaribacter uvawellassae TaxID=3133495 RepID=UPI00321A0A50